MPKARPKRRRPVTLVAAAAAATAAAAVPLPPIHVEGHEKMIIESQSTRGIKLGRLGKSSADTRRRINHFHTLIKECSKLAALKQPLLDKPGVSAETIREIDEKIEILSQEMTEMGGLDWYQKASLLGQSKKRGGDTSRWFVGKLKEMGLNRRSERLRLLDVGALSSQNYAKEAAWISVTPIDLNSQEPGIYKQDFLDIDPSCSAAKDQNEAARGDSDGDSDDDDDTNASHLFRDPFDVICLSLVVNFIGDPVKRGDMLKQATRLLVSDGLLYLVLPLSCVNNSRYLDDSRLQEITGHLGFRQLHSHHTAKLAHYIYSFNGAATSQEQAQIKFKKSMLHSAPGRNNFSIVV